MLNQLGRVLFLKRQFKEAIAEFDKVLAIDPEDLQAHYNLMLCYQGLGDSDARHRESGRCTSGSRQTNPRSRSPGRIANCMQKTTTSGNRSTSTGSLRRGFAKSARLPA